MLRNKKELQNCGSYKYSIIEYKAGEFGIVDEKNNQLLADCFESFDHAQDWYDDWISKMTKSNKATYETLPLIIEEKAVLKNREATHFQTILHNGVNPYNGLSEENYIEQGFIVIPMKEALELITVNEEKLYIGEWTEITESRWWEALECLPPLKYQTIDDITFFFCSEAYTGDIHSCYCEVNDKYYSAKRRTTTSYQSMIQELKEQNYV